MVDAGLRIVDFVTFHQRESPCPIPWLPLPGANGSIVLIEPMSPAPLAAAVKSQMTVDLHGGIRIRFEIPADHGPAERSEDRP